jgi:hypothetical protein
MHYTTAILFMPHLNIILLLPFTPVLSALTAIQIQQYKARCFESVTNVKGKFYEKIK